MYRLLGVMVVSFFILNSCSEEPNSPVIPTTVKISFPSENFIATEYDSVYIKVEVTANCEADTVELYATNAELWDDRTVHTFNQKPYETYLYLPQTCVEVDTLVLFAKAKFKTDEEIISNTVSGLVNSSLSNHSLMLYDYKGYDLDSNLVCEGLLSFFVKYSDGYSTELYGKREISPINEDLAPETGTAFIEGYYKISNGEFYGDLTTCRPVVYNGHLYSFVLYGTYSDTVITGERLLTEQSPVTTNLGSFIAIRR